MYQKNQSNEYIISIKIRCRNLIIKRLEIKCYLEYKTKIKNEADEYFKLLNIEHIMKIISQN